MMGQQFKETVPVFLPASNFYHLDSLHSIRKGGPLKPSKRALVCRTVRRPRTGVRAEAGYPRTPRH